MSDAAVANLITGLVTITTMVIGFLSLWLKLKYGVEKAEEAAVNAIKVERKIDQNTAITKEQGNAAREAADNAVFSANELAKQMNGMLDDRITTIVKSHTEALAHMFREHAKQDEANMQEIRIILAEFTRNKERGK